jgi:hypothetical protein
MAAATAHSLSGFFGSLLRFAHRERNATPNFDYARLTDHDLADLNLPPDLRARIAWERTRDALFRY